MECDCARLTVCFDEPFWVAVYEREEAGRLTVCRQEFGAEPRDGEVYRWLLSAWRTLVFSPAVGLDRRQTGRTNPKRARRQARAAAEQQGVGTKAQQALQLQREEQRQAHRAEHCRRDAAEAERKFRLRQEKKKEKHRGH